MDEEHFKRLNKYYDNSELGYDVLLWGSKHFGFHPLDSKVSEKEAQLMMQDLIGKKLRLSRSMNVLDAGCGQGVVASYLAKKFNCKITGITVVPFEITKAVFESKKLGIANRVRFYLMDYSNMKFKNNSFDAIYTIESLVHTTNVKKTLKEFFRVLKKGGRIALFEYTVADDKQFTDYEMRMLNGVMYTGAMDNLKDFRHDKFQKIIKGVGFKNVKAGNISQNVEPSLGRLRKFALIPYFFVKILNSQRNHPNLTTAVEFYKMGKKDLLRYNIFTAEK